LAKQCAQNGFDLLIAADEPAVNETAEILKRHGIAVEADLATTQGVDRLYAAAKARGRPIEALMAIRSCFLLGAERVLGIDTVPERLALARTAGAKRRDRPVLRHHPIGQPSRRGRNSTRPPRQERRLH
jgi:hypothetical protein